jgi:GH15 family glucan-1,4-alpha-glucosidase
VSSKRRRRDAYPPLSDYAFISDCHSSALVSRAASIDWCCMPRFDRGSTFARLLDWDRGGHCSLTPAGSGRVAASRAYVDGTLVLETTLRQGGAEVRVTDLFAMRGATDLDPHRQLIRVVDGVRGRMRLRLDVQPRFDYGGIRPWIRRESADVYGAIGGDDALAVWSDAPLEAGAHDLCAELTVGAGERVRVSLRYARPEELDRGDAPLAYEPEQVDRQIDETVRAWRRWTRCARVHGQRAPSVLRSAIVLKGLSYPPTGAMAAAPTTSLPEAVGASRNWDYRFTWIRDSTYSVRTLAEIGVDAEADAFRRFIQRSAAGHVDDLQIVYGLGGERRIGEQEVSELEGYRGSGPVRVGNGASGQTQLDAYGEIVNLTWRWHCRGNSPDDDMWRFVLELCNAAAKRWREPDAGLWEWRGRPLHWTYSKAMCWSALDRGLALAEESMREAPVARWKRARGQIRTAVERDGYDARRGTFRQVLGRAGVDASLLLLPRTGIVDWDDERMVGTADAVRDQLGDDGLVRRYSLNDGMRGREGAFLACSFWLAECLARQDRVEEARAAYDRAMAAGNDVGLFSEEFDTRRGEPCGNFPQALTHLAHIEAAQSLEQAEARQG